MISSATFKTPHLQRQPHPPSTHIVSCEGKNIEIGYKRDVHFSSKKAKKHERTYCYEIIFIVFFFNRPLRGLLSRFDVRQEKRKNKFQKVKEGKKWNGLYSVVGVVGVSWRLLNQVSGLFTNIIVPVSSSAEGPFSLACQTPKFFWFLRPPLDKINPTGIGEKKKKRKKR